ncbi:MAG: site-2 protease family protein [Actinobacteria bacterium]|nr:site-2 protease family protein [Actinomycetota bacterium]
MLLLLAVLAPSVILHEVAHGAVALRFGDPTAKEAGRLTLNPVRHVDPLGTIILPTILAVTGGAVFGWAKPVPVNPSRMRRPRDHGLVVSLAGPAVNIALAVGAALVFRAIEPEGGLGIRADEVSLRAYVVFFGLVNVVLAAFNLIPVPPLDGSAIIERFMPVRFLGPWHQVRQYSMLLVLGLVLLVPGALDTVFDVAIDLWARLL